MLPKLEVCKACQYLEVDQNKCATCMLHGTPWKDSIGLLTNGRKKLERNKTFTVPDDCPYALEHLLGKS